MRDREESREDRVVLAGRSIPRMGYGAMRLVTHDNDPAVPEEAARGVLRRAVELGVRLIDTAAFYGAGLANRLIAEALTPYGPDLLVSTKVGVTRLPDGTWRHDDRPEQLRAAVEENLTQLRRERLDVVFLRLTDGHGLPPSTVPLSDSLGALQQMRAEGLIGSVGLSNASLARVQEARRHAEIAAVQNLFNLRVRSSSDVLEWCTREDIPFLPYFPLATGELGRSDGPLTPLARRYGITPAQLALAWLLHLSPVVLPIPGSTSPSHVEENIRALQVRLASADVELLTRASPA